MAIDPHPHPTPATPPKKGWEQLIKQDDSDSDIFCIKREKQTTTPPTTKTLSNEQKLCTSSGYITIIILEWEHIKQDDPNSEIFVSIKKKKERKRNQNLFCIGSGYIPVSYTHLTLPTRRTV